MRFRNKLELSGVIASALVRRFFTAHRNFRKGGPRKIAVIRCDGLGDFVLWSVWGRALRDAFPDAELVFWGNAAWLPLACRVLPFDRFFGVEPRRFIADGVYRSEILSLAGRERCDSLLQARCFRETALEEVLAAALSPRRSAAFSVANWHLQPGLLKCFQRFYDELADPDGFVFEGERNRALMSLFTGTSVTACNFWSERPFEAPEPWRLTDYVVVLPGTGKTAAARWPVESFAAALAAVDLPLAVCGVPAERELCGELAARLGAKARAITDLKVTDFAGLLSHASLVVGGDTGGIHLAAHSGVPTVVAVGQGQPGWFLPYPDGYKVDGCRVPTIIGVPAMPCRGCFWRCVRSEEASFKCVADVPVASVSNEIDAILLRHANEK